MKTRTGKILLLLLFIPLQYINALEITKIETDAYIRGEFNRSFNYHGGLSATGAIELDNRYTFRGGISFGSTKINSDINTFIGARYSPFPNLPLHFSLSYIYNGLPEYNAHTHSILPVIYFNAKRAGISVGFNFRFTSFFGSNAQFESILSFYGYFNFINNDNLRIWAGAGNFSDFYAKNMGAYSLSFGAVVRIDSNWSIIGQLELMQSGGDGFSTNFYGIAWSGGAKYSW